MQDLSGISTECSVAFKEWACIIDSLGQGAQTAIVRKGGIHEREGVFSPEHNAFLLFPTLEHQNEADLNSKTAALLQASQNSAGACAPDTAELFFFARSEKVFWVSEERWIEPLAGMQALNAQALRKRFDYGDRRGFYVLLLRVFRQERALILPHASEYRGCKSWITLKHPELLGPLKPVLSEQVYRRQIEQFYFLESPTANGTQKF